MAGTLYIVATPIGNLKDITLRALEVLKEVDRILAEDTRVTRKLLAHHRIAKPIQSCHEHSPHHVYEEVKRRLGSGEKIALVSDAGTPGISDPGAKLVKFVKSQMLNVAVVPIPGPTALTAALSVSGIHADQFTFIGYPPHKKGRQKFFQALADIKIKPIVLYESPHRLARTLRQLGEIFGEEKRLTVAKELTKVHEEIFEGSLRETHEHFTGPKGKGEFVLILL